MPKGSAILVIIEPLGSLQSERYRSKADAGRSLLNVLKLLKLISDRASATLFSFLLHNLISLTLFSLYERHLTKEEKEVFLHIFMIDKFINKCGGHVVNGSGLPKPKPA